MLFIDINTGRADYFVQTCAYLKPRACCTDTSWAICIYTYTIMYYSIMYARSVISVRFTCQRFLYTRKCACPCVWVQTCACACANLRTDGLVRDCGVSSALAMETLRSRTGPSMYARTFVPTLSNNIRPPSRTSAWTVICIKPPRPSTVRSRYCTDRFDIKLQADSILTHRSRFGEPWVSAPSTPGNLSVL